MDLQLKNNDTDKITVDVKKKDSDLRINITAEGYFGIKDIKPKKEKKVKDNAPNESMGERECRRVLEEIFKKEFISTRPDFLRNPKTGKNLELDCYNEELNLAVEYNGRQHYEFTPCFHKDIEELEYQKFKDALKNELCIKQGVRLITIDYLTPVEMISDKLKSLLEINEVKLQRDLLKDDSFNNFKNNAFVSRTFRVKDKIATQTITLDFDKNFSIKLLGARRSGKTTWIINYLNKIYDDDFNFKEIYFFTEPSKQDLLFSLLRNKTVKFIPPENLSNYVKEYNHQVLFIFDDCMQEIKNDKVVETVYTKGRHMKISLFSLEQAMQYSNNTERANCDNILVFKQNDMKALDFFRQKFCLEIIETTLLNRMIEFCREYDLPLNISMNYPSFKYRSNFNERFVFNNELGTFYTEYILTPKVKKIIYKELPVAKKKKGFNKGKFIKISAMIILGPIWIPALLLKELIMR